MFIIDFSLCVFYLAMYTNLRRVYLLPNSHHLTPYSTSMVLLTAISLTELLTATMLPRCRLYLLCESSTHNKIIAKLIAQSFHQTSFSVEQFILKLRDENAAFHDGKWATSIFTGQLTRNFIISLSKMLLLSRRIVIGFQSKKHFEWF